MGEILEMVKKRVDEEDHNGGDGGNGEGPDPQFIRDCIEAVGYGDGTCFAELYRGKRVFNHSAQEWFYWTGHSWALDTGAKNTKMAVEDLSELYLQEKAIIDEELLGIEDAPKRKKALEAKSKFIAGRVKRLRSSAGRNECLEFASTSRVAIDCYAEQMDNQPTLLAVGNGVVDLKTGILRDGRPDDYLVKSSHTHYDPEEKSKLWEKTLWEIYEDQDKIDFIQRLIGAALLGYDREHILTVLFGQGRNGKDTVFETVSYVLGDIAGVIAPEMLLDQGRVKNSSGPSPDIMALKGLRLAVGSETTEGARFDVGRVKLLTGGGRLTGRWPHDKHTCTFEPTHTLFLLTNHKPSAGNDYAFWKRAYLISHPFSFVSNPKASNEKKIDKSLKSKLFDQATGVLTWAVEGTLAYLEGGLRPPACVLEDTTEYQRNEDMLADFIETCCVISRELGVKFPGIKEEKLFECEPCNLRTSFKDIKEAFEAWYQAYRGKKVPSSKFLGDKLGERFEKKKSGTTYYLGIGITPNWDDNENSETHG